MTNTSSISALTSGKVRVIAQEAITSYNRPMTAHEIEKFIKLNDKDLWKDDCGKCYDYVRMILSVSKLSAIIKYKCLKRIIGVDKRANFYGLATKTYDTAVWLPLGKQISNKQSDNIPQDINITIQNDIIQPIIVANNDTNTNNNNNNINNNNTFTNNNNNFATNANTEQQTGKNNVLDFKNEITFQNVTEEAAVESWRTIHQKMKVNDPVWNVLPSAMKETHDYSVMGFNSKDIVQFAINKYTPLQDKAILNDAIVILCRVIIESKDE
ncbi:hypothetical protein TRFO_32620 [Tritrichomonas foetus]|uniref:Uncharacterized protein n=1 Tax=Tritrichomonas foetus TaxID=1144522 RepID=A0A1J4JNJ2_9EUKA|nr:hypothetical protein TRFO_32620 [Tritrichomonas foetus]|eukprot:OHT00651.1 hypothetical protein TRFO_32620 [Tritrichomonas foetus]